MISDDLVSAREALLKSTREMVSLNTIIAQASVLQALATYEIADQLDSLRLELTKNIDDLGDAVRNK